jgi:hypothetical protein
VHAYSKILDAADIHAENATTQQTPQQMKGIAFYPRSIHAGILEWHESHSRMHQQRDSGYVSGLCGRRLFLGYAYGLNKTYM